MGEGKKWKIPIYNRQITNKFQYLNDKFETKGTKALRHTGTKGRRGRR